LTVIAPTGAHVTKFSNLRHTNGRCGVGFQAYIYLEPANVSFANTTFAEGTVAAVASGYYASLNGLPHPPTAIPKPVGNCNTTNGCTLLNGAYDTVDTNDGSTPFSIGNFLWAIPWNYQVGSAALTQFTTANHSQTTDATGKATIQKAGAGPFSKNANDSTSTY
jgi:hypothetical protein